MERRALILTLMLTCGCLKDPRYPQPPTGGGGWVLEDANYVESRSHDEVLRSGGAIEPRVCRSRADDAGQWVEQQETLRTPGAEMDESLRREIRVHRRDGTFDEVEASVRRAAPEQIADRAAFVFGCVE